jgi:glycosyltransferase involved in cell wall biosynthesis
MTCKTNYTNKAVSKSIVMVVDNEFDNDIRVNNEARVLANNGFAVIIICFSFGNSPTYELREDIEIYRIRINRKVKNILFGILNTIPLYYIFWYQKLKKILSKLNVDAVHAHDLYMAEPAGKVARKLGIPLILDLHENYPEAIKTYQWANKKPYKYLAKPNKWSKIEKEYLLKASKTILLSDQFAHQIQEKYPEISSQNLWVYPNVPDIDEMLGYKVTKTELDSANYFNLLYFGGISRRRGVYTCIKAIEILKNEHSDIRLVLIGPVDGSEKAEFNQTISHYSVSDSIVHIPWINISQFPSYLNDCHACLSPIVKNPQHESGIANKVFQYMLFEKPIIVSNCGPQSQIVNEGQCGLVFESENEKDLAKKILELYNDKDLQKQYGLNGKKLVIDKYNTNYFGKQLVQNYRNLFSQQIKQN